MKTSINVPDWLHDQVQAATPGLSFSEACRDALLLCLPKWAGENDGSGYGTVVKARLRMATAEVERARAPDTRPNGRPAGARKSGTRRKAPSAPGRRS